MRWRATRPRGPRGRRGKRVERSQGHGAGPEQGAEAGERSSDRACLPSLFVYRVANGCERAASTDGEYYIDCKVYHANDARNTDSLELWKKAIVRIKFQADVDSPQWRKL
ncbi:hypothetical protein HF086_002809 [Spodoptera exigua]|uniref:Uncharacterized protein n=1 Tax=Spodoptera exigua TaxID=7107 RepID=A0A922SGT2_SPOEX|nr:hypothetical protein HF086_002809 [Spodoptera exigua]